MLDQALYPYYLTYAGVVVVLLLTNLRVRGSEPVVITTKEFKRFQGAYLAGYALSLLGELFSNAYFYYIFSDNAERCVRLYVVTTVSSTVFSSIFEIVDIGSRKNKAVLSALLYAAGTASALATDQPDVLYIGRALYGAASALHHSSFEAYVVHEHSSLGFPDEWLGQTFTLLTHVMALLAFLVGAVGQTTAAYGGRTAAVSLTLASLVLTALFVSSRWTADISGPRFLLQAFSSNLLQTVAAARRNRLLSSFLVISSMSETAFLVFSYLWAQLLTAAVKGEDAVAPYALVFSAYLCASMVGAYAHSLLSARVGAETFFQAVLSGLVAAFSLASTVQTPTVMLLSSLLVYACIGAYWPCAGTLRAKAVGAEQRGACQTLTRGVSSTLASLALIHMHHSATLSLITCAGAVASAAVVQSFLVQQDGATSSYDSNKKEQARDAA